MTAYREPVGEQLAGRLHFRRMLSFYERYMEEQGLPVARGLGVADVRELPLAPWSRTGGQGAFIQLDGTGDQAGMYVVEVPARGALRAERHFYEETMLVVRGRGSTEVWRDGGSGRQSFEWQPGSLFAVPLNAWHRLVNAGSEPALLIGVTTAPITMNLFPSVSFIFENPFEWPERYAGEADYFKPRDEFEPHPEHGRALLRSNFIPDIVNCYLPLDNSRSPGYRVALLNMGASPNFDPFIHEFPSGRYSKAHFHQSGAVLINLKGKGYTYNWPKQLGYRPWQDGHADQVKYLEYGPWGIVAAAPGGGDWFHQHFSVGKDPLRQVNLTNASRSGGLRPVHANNDARAEHAGVGAEISEGGYGLPYREEDPFLREAYREALAREGVPFEMPESAFQ